MWNTEQRGLAGGCSHIQEAWQLNRHTQDLSLAPTPSLPGPFQGFLPLLTDITEVGPVGDSPEALGRAAGSNQAPGGPRRTRQWVPGTRSPVADTGPEPTGLLGLRGRPSLWPLGRQAGQWNRTSDLLPAEAPGRKHILKTRTNGCKKWGETNSALHWIHEERLEGTKKLAWRWETDKEAETQHGKPLPMSHSLLVRASHQWECQTGRRQEEASLCTPSLHQGLGGGGGCISSQIHPHITVRVRGSEIQIRWLLPSWTPLMAPSVLGIKATLNITANKPLQPGPGSLLSAPHWLSYLILSSFLKKPPSYLSINPHRCRQML